MSQTPPAAGAPARKKKKRGCCSCCLWLVLLVVLLGASFAVAAHFIMRDPPNPVKEEYETIPDYFSRLAPPDISTTQDTHLTFVPLSRLQPAGIRFTTEAQRSQRMQQELRAATAFNPQSASGTFTTNHTKYTNRFSIRNPQSAIRNCFNPQSAIVGGAHV